jgi:hypothetical protein
MGLIPNGTFKSRFDDEDIPVWRDSNLARLPQMVGVQVDRITLCRSQKTAWRLDELWNVDHTLSPMREVRQRELDS